MEHRGIGVLVRGDVQSAASRLFDLGDEATDRSPIVAGPHLEVEQVHRYLSLLGDPDGEVDLLFLLVPLAPVV